jgi:hypothetical protein
MKLWDWLSYVPDAVNTSSYDPKGLHKFVVELRESGTLHRLTRTTFDTWLSVREPLLIVKL